MFARCLVRRRFLIGGADLSLTRAVTGSTFLRRRLVEEHGPALEWSSGGVAGLATHALMSARQRETRAPLVIEEGRFPLGCIVAVGAGRDVVRISELRAMNVLMALLTPGGRRLEVHIHHSGFQVRRLVAVDTGCTTMSAQKREGGFRVIEFLQISPGGGGMASLAAGWCAIGLALLNAILELSFMRIGMADGTGAVLEAIHHSVRIL